MPVREKIRSFFSEGHERTLLAKKNIALSFLIKAGSILIGFVLMPVVINYVSATEYGLWLTLSSIIGWLSFFDIGLGNGLKNKLANANALKQYDDSKSFVSTTYAVLSIISLALFFVFTIMNFFLDWNKILNTGKAIPNLNTVALVVVAIFCIQFIAQILNTVLTACHLIAKVSLIYFVGQLVTLISVILLTRFTHSSLLLLVIINGGVPVVIQFLASFWYFGNQLKTFSPDLKLVKFKYAKELIGTGTIFFFIQIGALILFQTDNIVVVQLFGPAHVTTFNAAYKLFSAFLLGFNIIVTPLWSAFTDAYAINDMMWIKGIIRKMQYLWLGLSAGVIVLYFLAPSIYKIWLKDDIQEVPTSLSLAMAFYVIAYSWQTIHVYFLNGISKIRLQLYLVIASSIINIPLAIFFGRKIGLAGITWSNTLLFTIMGVVFYVQTNKLLNKTATGVFNS